MGGWAGCRASAAHASVAYLVSQSQIPKKCSTFGRRETGGQFYHILRTVFTMILEANDIECISWALLIVKFNGKVGINFVSKIEWHKIMTASA